MHCCYRDGLLYKAPSRTTPPGGPSSKARAGCYAAALNDCGNVLSREHYLSDSILEQLDYPLKLSGLSWISDTPHTISSESLKAKVLCKRHNEALTGLDASAGRLFKTLKSFQLGLASGWTLLAGEDIERWMLKLLIGLVVSGSICDLLPTKEKAIPPEPWLRILFGYDEMPEGWGLHFIENSKDEGAQMRVIGIRLFSHLETGVVAGIIVGLMDFTLLLCMSRLNWNRPEYHVYRPRRFYLENDAAIELSWKDPSFDRAIVIARTA